MALTLSRRRGQGTPATLLNAARFEIVPLRDALDATDDLPSGATVTVTASPSRGITATVDLAVALAGRGFRAVPHLAAREIRDEDELTALVGRLTRAGIDDVFVVGGDAPDAAGQFRDGLALLSTMARLGHRFDRVGVPSYPEGHHAIGDDTLWRVLVAKQRYATYTVTQLCFDAETIARFSLQARYRGITLPIIAGVPGAVDAAKLLRVSLRVGVGPSVKFVRGHRAVARRLLRPGGFRPDGLIRRMERNVHDGTADISGLHIYTFNQTASTAAWLRGVRPRQAA